jgi:NAD(P)-dependent dehydrogenase (short-subunit alcohol dehydrogenase family)
VCLTLPNFGAERVKSGGFDFPSLTGMLAATLDEVWKERDALYPPGRVVTAEEVAETIAFLASKEAGGVSGQAVSVALGGIY